MHKTERTDFPGQAKEAACDKGTERGRVKQEEHVLFLRTYYVSSILIQSLLNYGGGINIPLYISQAQGDR